MSHANLSRRAIMSGAAALPALAMPPVASAMSAEMGDNPDAELLALGTELDSIVAEWLALRETEISRWDAHEAACIRAGLPRIEHGSVPDDEWRAHLDKRAKVRMEYSEEEDAEHDEHGTNLVWESFHDRQHELCDELYTYKPLTSAGLAVQARAFTLDYSEFWVDEYEADDNRRIFVELVCAFLGVVPVPMQVVTRQTAREAVQS
jgi:hypothetical protein